MSNNPCGSASGAQAGRGDPHDVGLAQFHAELKQLLANATQVIEFDPDGLLGQVAYVDVVGRSDLHQWVGRVVGAVLVMRLRLPRRVET